MSGWPSVALAAFLALSIVGVAAFAPSDISLPENLAGESSPHSVVLTSLDSFTNTVAVVRPVEYRGKGIRQSLSGVLISQNHHCTDSGLPYLEKQLSSKTAAQANNNDILIKLRI